VGSRPFCGVTLLVFSFWSLLGWNFFYPTPAEQYLWRACVIIQAVGGIYGGTHYVIVGFRWHAAYEKAQQAARVQGATILAGWKMLTSDDEQEEEEEGERE